MDATIITTIISAFVALIVALIPYLRPRTRYVIVTLIVCGLLAFWIIDKLYLSQQQVIAELQMGLNTPPVFETPLGSPGSIYDEVSLSAVIKIVNKDASEKAVTDIQSVFIGTDGDKSYAKSQGRPGVERAYSLDGILAKKAEFLQFPFIIPSKIELYLRIYFKLYLFDKNGERLKYKFLNTGYTMLPTIMKNPSIEIFLNDGSKIKVGTKEYYPIFVGQKLVVSQEGIVSEIWETSMGNLETHTPQIDHFGIFWKSHVRIRKETGIQEVREWFNELPWYEGNLKTSGGQISFEVSDIVPYVEVSKYGRSPLEFYLMEINKEELKQGEFLKLVRYISNEGRSTFDKEIPLEPIQNNTLKCKTIVLDWENPNGIQYLYMFIYVKGKQLLFWPFKLYYIESLLERSM